MISVPYASFNWIRFYELAPASQPWHQSTDQTNAPQQIAHPSQPQQQFQARRSPPRYRLDWALPQNPYFQKFLLKFSIKEHLFFMELDYPFPKE
jgi:hypothetical protein